MLQSSMQMFVARLRLELQVARACNVACTSKLQVSPLRRKSAPSVEMTDLVWVHLVWVQKHSLTIREIL